MSRPEPRREQGLTLVELLVTMMISGLLLVLTLEVVNSNRRLYDTDSRRVEVNQNLQSALRVVSNDVRQTGERLRRNVPALELRVGSSDTLTIRRNLLDVVLPLCADLDSGTTAATLYVALQPGTPVADCQAATPALVAPWEAFRNAHGGAVKAFIFDPVHGRGETFTYDAADAAGRFIHRSGGTWLNSYRTNDGPVIYLLETRTYAVTAGQLTLSVDGESAEAVAPSIGSLKVSLTLKDGSVPSGDFPTSGTSWKDVRSVQLSLSGSSTSRGKTTSRALSETVTPRNAFSAED
ncbi:PilW family protein [Deinococcus koreensis]|uniref:Prepilin-type cleavage/methylation domain-containing protein n=1 Tax=Deinococcus koreensis TaxID=2054903 RepID=A0A2K3UXA4_9DEIO|nr:prepilin-type N-terminal cleavage/methylation domain-containing protein [Deinococcus koreensis]PNY81166.1 hypothetical protein CVO96_07040 [Deinococcus koreensis]